MKTYRCKHAVEAMRWTDTDDSRELFAAWFEEHGAVFETFGPVVVLPEEGRVNEGEWILCSDNEFITMGDEEFRDSYEEVAE